PARAAACRCRYASPTASVTGSSVSGFLHALVLLHEQAVQNDVGHARAVQGGEPRRVERSHITRSSSRTSQFSYAWILVGQRKRRSNGFVAPATSRYSQQSAALSMQMQLCIVLKKACSKKRDGISGNAIQSSARSGKDQCQWPP